MLIERARKPKQPRTLGLERRSDSSKPMSPPLALYPPQHLSIELATLGKTPCYRFGILITLTRRCARSMLGKLLAMSTAADETSRGSTSSSRLRILSLDGGGSRGISSLLILENIMEKIREVQNLDHVPRPCGHFDLIGGTSTGGIIAIMLGRLRMTVDECIRAYSSVAQKAFTRKRSTILPASPSGAFSAKALEAAMKEVVKEYCIEPECVARRNQDLSTAKTCPHDGMAFCDEACTNTVVLAVRKESADAPPTLFKTYDTSASFRGCAIWQVARATSAATTFFKPIKLGRDNVEFVDAGFGYNNPCEVLIDEAQHQFPDRRQTQILSIGTGLGDAIAIGNSRLSIIHALKKMATTSKQTADRLERRYGESGQYYRFNVDRGLQDIALSDWEKSSEISAHTHTYLDENQRAIRKFVDSFTGVSTESGIRGEEPSRDDDREQQAPAAGSQLVTPSKYFVMPYTSNPDFIGRSDILEKLKSQLSFDRATNRNSQPRAALFGLGGVGKSQIAIEYVYWLRETCPEASIFWVHASKEERFRQAFASIYQECNVAKHDDPQTDVLLLTKAWLERKDQGPWLMVIDNADDTELFFASTKHSESSYPKTQAGNMARYIPECVHGSILVTTRTRQMAFRLAKGGRSIEVGKMGNDDAAQLLRTRLDEIDLAPPDLSALSCRLEYLPLALVQAASFIQENAMSVSKYLELLKGGDHDLVALLSEEFEPVGRDSETPHALTETWIISFTQIERQNALAADLMSIMSFFDRQAIPTEFLSNYVQRRERAADRLQDSESTDPIKFEKALGILKSFSFISQGRDGDVDMHRLIQLVTRKWLAKKDSMPHFEGQALLTVSKCYPSGTFENLKSCGERLPHALAVLDQDGSGSSEEKIWRARLLHQVSSFFGNQGNWKDGRSMGTQALELQIEMLGEEDPLTLLTMNNLAMLHKNLGRWDEAEKLQVQLVEAGKRVLGDEHSDTLAYISSLASTYWRQGRLDEAEELEVRVLEASKRAFGDEHPSTLTYTNNLSTTFISQGRWGEAEELQVQALEMSKRILGDEHPNTLVSIINLAATYGNQGRLLEAEELQVQALEMSKRILGDEHPDTLVSIRNLAATYGKQGRLLEAEELQVQALEMSKRILRVGHPDTLLSMRNLAVVYQRQDRYTDALALMEDCVRIGQRVLGPGYFGYVGDSAMLDRLREVSG